MVNFGGPSPEVCFDQIMWNMNIPVPGSANGAQVGNLLAQENVRGALVANTNASILADQTLSQLGLVLYHSPSACSISSVLTQSDFVQYSVTFLKTSAVQLTSQNLAQLCNIVVNLSSSSLGVNSNMISCTGYQTNTQAIAMVTVKESPSGDNNSPALRVPLAGIVAVAVFGAAFLFVAIVILIYVIYRYNKGKNTFKLDDLEVDGKEYSQLDESMDSKSKLDSYDNI